MKQALTLMARRLLPLPVRRGIIRYTRWPPVGLVIMGHLRRPTPISPYWGSERGQPVDRYYIEHFLAAHAADIQGRVLEIGDNTYTRLFGGDGVVQSDVLHVAEDSPQVTIIGDLTHAENLPENAFDCFIVTQTLQLIYDVPAAIRTMHQALKPGGVALVTVPGISKISRYDMDRWGHYWSFTSLSARRLFEATFPASHVQVEAHGNVLAAIAFLHGLASQELRPRELDRIDPDYQVLITIRAVKPEETPCASQG
jgi:SAM-dependent methyltransferase